MFKAIRANNVGTIILFYYRLLFIALLARIAFLEICSVFGYESGVKPPHSKMLLSLDHF